MLITRKSPFSGETRTIYIDVTLEQLEAWKNGELIQNAMPNIPADEREFIKTGITPEDWAKAFGEDV